MPSMLSVEKGGKCSQKFPPALMRRLVVWLHQCPGESPLLAFGGHGFKSEQTDCVDGMYIWS